MEVCSPPISMFVAPLDPDATDVTASVALTSCDVKAATCSASEEGIGQKCALEKNNRTRIPPTNCCFAPDPLFTSDRHSPVLRMDSRRIALYRSLGLVVGLAVRTGVALPQLSFTETWWKLVANEPGVIKSSGLDRWTKQPTVMASGRPLKSTSRAPDNALRPLRSIEVASPLSVEDKSLPPLDRVLRALDRLFIGEEGPTKDTLEDFLADARFVAPLSNGMMAELVPGGESREQCASRFHAVVCGKGSSKGFVRRSTRVKKKV